MIYSRIVRGIAWAIWIVGSIFAFFVWALGFDEPGHRVLLALLIWVGVLLAGYVFAHFGRKMDRARAVESGAGDATSGRTNDETRRGKLPG